MCGGGGGCVVQGGICMQVATMPMSVIKLLPKTLQFHIIIFFWQIKALSL